MYILAKSDRDLGGESTFLSPTTCSLVRLDACWPRPENCVAIYTKSIRIAGHKHVKQLTSSYENSFPHGCKLGKI